MIAFHLSRPDNGSHMFGDPDVERCPRCGYVLDRNYVSHSLRVRDRRWDFGFTYDNVPIVSRRFSDYCAGLNLPGLELIPLPADQGFVVFQPIVTVPFDAERRKTRFENRCDACEEFESVVGATPAFLRLANLPHDDGVFRTDLEFGSGDERQPLIIASPSVASRLRDESFNGIEFGEVLGQ